MEKLNKLLLLVFSLLMVFGISLNTNNYIYADDEDIVETTNEDTSQNEDVNYVSQRITFVDNKGNPIELDDSITFARLEKQGDTEVPVPVNLVDGKDNRSDEAYDYGEELTLDIEDGSIYTDSLIEDETYLIFFNGNYVFKTVSIDEDNQTENIDYYWYGSFIAGQNEELEISYNTSIEAIYNEDGTQRISDEKLAEIAQTGNIMFLYETTYYRGNCKAAEDDGLYFYVKVTSPAYSAAGYGSYVNAGSASATGTVTFTPVYNDNVIQQAKYSVRKGSYSGTEIKSGYATPGESIPISCADWGYGDDCTSGSTSCNNGYSVKQTYDSNGGSCTKGSDTRTRSSDTKSCSKGYWGKCSGGTWSGSVSAPSCSHSDTTEGGTVYFSSNENSGTFSYASLSETSHGTSRTEYWTFDGFDNYSTSFTSNTTATAKYHVSSTGSWSNVTLPTASRRGYTFKGWSDSSTGSAQYSSGQTVAGGNRTYYAIWEANTYSYTIKYVSSTGKALGETTYTAKFDTTNTITAPAKDGYNTPAAQSVKWDQADNNKVITFTYPIITYNISYDLQLPAANTGGTVTTTGVNNAANPSTYTIESPTITLQNPSRRGYTFESWSYSSNFSDVVTEIPSGSIGNRTFYAKFNANPYPLTVKNVNDRVDITFVVNNAVDNKNETITLKSGESATRQVYFDNIWTVTTGKANPEYYTTYVASTTRGGIKNNTISTRMDEGETVTINAKRNYKTFTATLKNDNDYLT